jgi:chromosome partitioning protein
VGARFDVILMDAPPTLGSITRMTLAATDSFLVPVQAEEFAFRTLDRLFQAVGDIRRDFNPELACEGLLVTMADLRTRMSVRVINQLHEQHGDKVLMSMVPRTVSVQEMPVRGKPTVVYASRSRGGLAYGEVAQEILANLHHEASRDDESEDHQDGDNGRPGNGADEIDRLLAQIRPGGSEDQLRIQ